MAALRHLILAALCAGSLAGIFVTAARQVSTVPLILQAEVNEKPAAHATAWEPETGVERTAYTLLADVLTGIGFALLLVAGLSLRGGDVTWRAGLFWGLGGFAAVTLAPSLGLPPQLPGTEAAPLLDRQLWWLWTAVSTGCALVLLAFTRRPAWAVVGAILIVLPHLYGAPRSFEHATAVPEALAQRFVVTTAVVNFLFWLILGASSGYFYRLCRLHGLGGAGTSAWPVADHGEPK
jgi:cobalt transporter subunit CbtA